MVMIALNILGETNNIFVNPMKYSSKLVGVNDLSIGRMLVINAIPNNMGVNMPRGR